MRVRVGIRADTYIPGGQVGEDIDIWATEDSPESMSSKDNWSSLRVFWKRPPISPGS